MQGCLIPRILVEVQVFGFTVGKDFIDNLAQPSHCTYKKYEVHKDFSGHQDVQCAKENFDQWESIT